MIVYLQVYLNFLMVFMYLLNVAHQNGTIYCTKYTFLSSINYHQVSSVRTAITTFFLHVNIKVYHKIRRKNQLQAENSTLCVTQL